MKTKRKQELSSSDLTVGDVIDVAGMRCTVIKIDSVFHYRPDARLRFSLRSDDYLGKGADIILFLGHNVPVKTRK
jgi:hypothetical protein